MSEGDPYRIDPTRTREKLAELERKAEALRDQIRVASFDLDRRYQLARVPERDQAGSSNLLGVVVVILALLGFVGTTFGWQAVAFVFVAALVIGVNFLVRSSLRPPPRRHFDPTRYANESAPAHLRAEYKWLVRDLDAADALEAEIRETQQFLEAQERRDSR